MFEKITKENWFLFAMKHYENPKPNGESEIYDDMKRFKYIKRLFRKYKSKKILKENVKRDNPLWIGCNQNLMITSNVLI